MWYQLYDDAVRDVERGQWHAAEQKLIAAKKTGPKPGRRVFRYGQLREPFLPDFYLAQVYAALAAETTDPNIRRQLAEKALQAFADASSTQVGQRDPEYAMLAQTQLTARHALETPAPLGGSPVAPATPGEGRTPERATREDPLIVARAGLRRLLEEGERALADGAWDTAADRWQQAETTLTQHEALKGEFPQVAARMQEALLARSLAAARALLMDGRFDAAADAYEKAAGQTPQAALTSAPLRALVADMPARRREARAGQALRRAHDSFLGRQWRDALTAYEEARALLEGVVFSSAQGQALAAQASSRLQEAALNTALAERRYNDALRMDPGHRGARDGQYARALDAFNAGRWQDAAAEFDVLRAHAPDYRDAVDRAVAAELQVAYVLGVQAVQLADTAAARGHFERVVQLQRDIRGPLMETAAVVRSVEAATDSLRRIDARAALATARRQYENGQWDEARNGVNLVLRVLPSDPEATELLQLLNDSATGQQVQSLTTLAREALARRDLDAATEAAVALRTLLPQNADAAFVLTTVARMRDERRRQYQWLAAGAVLASVGPALLVSTRRRGRFFAAIGRPAAALRLYDSVLGRHPTDGSTLSRAAALALGHGISAPLSRHFETYLAARPDDLRIAQAAADYFWHEGDRGRAAGIYERLLIEAPSTMKPTAFERLAEHHHHDTPDRLIVALERARARRSDPPLLQLLATLYARQHRVDAEALEVYRVAVPHAPDVVPLRLALAGALLAAGEVEGAIAEAGEAVRREPTPASLVLLARALSRAEEEPETVATRLEALQLAASTTLVVAEQVAEVRASIRPALSALYARLAAPEDRTLEAVIRAHGRLDAGDLHGAKFRLQQVSDVAPDDSLTRQALLDVHRRELASAAAAGQSLDAPTVARMGQLHTIAEEWDHAITSWQSIVSVPEWNRRAMSAIQSILDSRPIADLARAYFATSGWQVAATDSSLPRATICLVTPTEEASTTLRTRFANTPVFCYADVVGVDDVVALKREVLARGRGSQDSVAFLVSTQALRHDVYALIYAFMTEDPAVTVVPLEAQSVRDAIIEARGRVHLERTLHQWLGHTDIYETHNPVSNAATFFGRGHFINQLVLKISRGENFGIFGLRKVGKTSLVYRLRELSRDHLVAYVDLQGVSSGRTSEVYLRLLDSLVRDMRVKHPDVALPPLQLTPATAVDPDVPSRFHADLLALRQALERTMTAPPNVLLLLDEIELMVPLGRSPGFEGHQDFFRHLRGLFQQERFVVSAVVGATPSVCRTAKWGVRDNPVFQFYDEIFLAMLDPVECDQMVEGLGELMGVRFDEPSLSLIFEQTGGHPYVTRQLCSRLVRSFPTRPLEVTPAMVRRALDEYLAQRGDYFAGLVEGYLDDDSRRIVEEIATADEAGETRHRLLQALAGRTGPHITDRVLGDLELVGLLVRDGDLYTLRAPLFRRWLRRSWLGLE